MPFGAESAWPSNSNCHHPVWREPAALRDLEASSLTVPNMPFGLVYTVWSAHETTCEGELQCRVEILFVVQFLRGPSLPVASRRSCIPHADVDVAPFRLPSPEENAMPRSPYREERQAPVALLHEAAKHVLRREVDAAGEADPAGIRAGRLRQRRPASDYATICNYCQRHTEQAPRYTNTVKVMSTSPKSQNEYGNFRTDRRRSRGRRRRVRRP